MQAYTKTISKKDFLKELKAHQKADNFVKGTYWREGKGCAVGCSIESISRAKNLGLTDYSNHSHYTTHLGIPEWLGRLEDALFESMSSGRAKKWPVEFAAAINVGADLEPVKAKFIIMILKHSLKSMSKAKYDAKKFPDVAKAIAGSKSAVQEMIRCASKGLDLTAARSAAWSAESAARSAAWSAESAARSAARSARSAARSAWSAESAAWSVEFAARSAAWSAESAARSAARSAAESAESAARSAARSAAESAEFAARSAESAAWSAWSAESAAWSAWSAESAARSAAESAESAARSAAWSVEFAARSAARSAAYDYYGTQLIKMLKACKGKKVIK